MTTAPERIWATTPSNSGCVVSFTTPSMNYNVQYTRTDLVDAMIAEAVAKEREQVVNIVRQSAKDARDVFSDAPQAKDAVDYMEQLIYAAIRAGKGE